MRAIAEPRSGHRRGMLALALLLAGLGQLGLATENPLWGWMLFAIAAPMAVYGLTGRSAGRQHVETRPAPGAPPEFSWSRARLGMACLSGVCSGLALYLLWRDDASCPGFWLWLLSLGAMAWAAPGARSSGPQRLRRLEIVVVVLLLLLATFVRLFRLNDLPPGVFIDETNAAMDALGILDGQHVSAFATGWFETPTLYAFYMAGLFRLLGASFFALKLASILPGLLTVAALYPLARRAFGPATALLSLFLLTMARWHIHMSRWGWNELMPPLFQILVAFFLLRALDTARPRDFVLAGLALGTSQYTYLAARLVPLMVLLFLLHQALTVRRFLRRHAVHLVLLALVSLMAFAPLGLTYLKEPFLFTNRARQVSLLNDLEAAQSLQPLWQNLLQHLGMFNQQGDANPRHNLPRAPMLDPFTGLLLPLAVGHALYHWRDRRYALLLLWIGVTLLGGILSASWEAPQAYRTLGVLPAVTLLLGDFLARLWQRFSPPDRMGPKAAVGAAVGVFLALSAAHNLWAYFVTYARDPRIFWAFTPLETGIARTAADVLASHDLYLAPKLAHFSSLRFATYRSPSQGGGGLSEPPYRLFSPLSDLPLAGPSERPALVILETQYLSLVSLLTHYHPDGIIHVHRAPDGQPLYLTLEVPRQTSLPAVQTPPPGQGLWGRYYRGSDWQGEPVVERLDPLLLFHWYAGEPLPDPFSVRWEGEIVLPVDGAYFLALVGDDGVRLWLDGRLLGESLRPNASNVVEAHVEMAAGVYPIRVDYFQRSGAKLIEFRWVRPGGQLELVPPDALRPAASGE
ncbi:MAG: PA14 domain-containing protein [Chloroflexota bacterium]